ncbi:uncharacterized protein LY79DRAFT_550412 [Colletotrichum navitas]|uniref:Uncharacterized protein n=1 Tax=Colletotrichum navitas TaxID=681940 RepID=A0AAD8V5P4_9PEZI|nr:uncharacterized protein LY79DRAFT_550412 [Colletotrichum navitas]KAK1593959.1 hypothetical protein LY79DRAFT_550412 [Colletotrichum navitas]
MEGMNGTADPTPAHSLLITLVLLLIYVQSERERAARLFQCFCSFRLVCFFLSCPPPSSFPARLGTDTSSSNVEWGFNIIPL